MPKERKELKDKTVIDLSQEVGNAYMWADTDNRFISDLLEWTRPSLLILEDHHNHIRRMRSSG